MTFFERISSFRALSSSVVKFSDTDFQDRSFQEARLAISRQLINPNPVTLNNIEWKVPSQDDGIETQILVCEDFKNTISLHVSMLATLLYNTH